MSERGIGQTLARMKVHVARRLQLLACGELPVSRRIGMQFALHPAVRDEFRKLLGREGSRFVYDRGGVRFVSAPVGSGTELGVAADGFALVLKELFAEPGLFYRNVRPPLGGVVLDVGGNVGTTAYTLSKAVGAEGQVYTFEPLVAETLGINARANGLHNVEVVSTAVGDQVGWVEMGVTDFCADSRITTSDASRSAGGRVLRVPITTIDAWAAEKGLKKIDFIKVDVEGAEELVIRGAEEVIRRFRPRWSISSYHMDFTGVPQHPKLVSLLKERGYHLKECATDHIYAW